MITTTKDDVILVGHGTYQGGAQNFAVPTGVELHICQTVGSAMTVGAAGMLLSNTPVDRGVLIHPPKEYDDYAKLGFASGTVYAAGKLAPNLILHDLGPQAGAIKVWAGKGASTVVMVSADSLLSDLLTKNATVLARLKAAGGKTVRFFWAACAVQEQSPQYPVVYFNGRAVAEAALAYSATNATNTPAKSAAAAADQWSMQNPGDTAGTIAAATKIDATTANLLQSL